LALRDRQAVAELRAERYGADSPEALDARVSFLALDISTSLDAGDVLHARERMAELEAMTRDGAEGEAILTQQSLIRLHSALKRACERLGDAQAVARHDDRLDRLVHVRTRVRSTVDDGQVPTPEFR